MTSYLQATPYGPVLGRSDVQNAVITTLQTWLVDGLAEVERQEGLAPHTIPCPGNSYPPVNLAAFRGGIDFERYQSDELPLLVVVAQPFDQADRVEAGVYLQWFDVRIAAITNDSDQEIMAEQVADWYGKALTLMVQHGGLGTRVEPDAGKVIPFAVKTVLVSAPRTEFVDLTDRKLARSVLALRTLVPVVNESQGPRTPPADPYTAELPWPVVETVTANLVVNPLP